MIWQIRFCVALLIGVGLANSVKGQSTLQQSLNDLDVGPRWRYNDWESAKATAARLKKPILALFR